MRRMIVAAVFAVALVDPASGDTLPLEQIRPGMTGVGRTVFDGTRVDEFGVRILGVLENVLGPNQSLIMGRLEGGRLADTGVIAGMSGSPVFVDGKLIGAVSYGFPFSKETIAGITPIGDMIEATRTESPRAASARFAPAFGPGGPAGPMDREAFTTALKRPLRAVRLGRVGDDAEVEVFKGEALPGRLAGLTLTPLSLPLTFSGFDPAAFEWAKGIFAAAGFTPLLSAGHAAVPPGPLPSLEPGAAVGISLVEGDLDLSVTGTITHIDKDRVYAFGHPFFNLGPTQFPMKKAYVFSVFPSLYQSWKISTAVEDVGTIDQDRTAAVGGRIGRTPRMIPVEVKLNTSRGQERRYSFRIVEDELFSPVLAFVSLLSVLQTNERTFGTSTMRVDARLILSKGGQVRMEDFFTQEQPAVQSAALVAAPIAFLMSNDFERVTLEKVDVDVSSYETIQSARIDRAWLARSGPIRPGTTVPLRLALRTYRGETASETIPVSIPATARAGTYTLLVADAAALTAMEQREMRQSFIPKDLEQLIRAINGLRHNNHIYARLLRADEGAIVSGEYLPSLPPSILSVLGRSDQGSSVISIRTASIWDYDLPTSYAVTGSRNLTLAVEP